MGAENVMRWKVGAKNVMSQRNLSQICYRVKKGSKNVVHKYYDVKNTGQKCNESKNWAKNVISQEIGAKNIMR